MKVWFQLYSIISGFKTCGMHPFNPKAVLDHDPCELKTSDPKSTDAAQCCLSRSSNLMQYENTVAHNSSHNIANTFIPEEESKFATRYNEGYDLPDQRYLAWLQLAHPEEHGLELLGHFQDIAPLDPLDLSTAWDDLLNNDHLYPSTTRDERLNPRTTCNDCLNPRTTRDDHVDPSTTHDDHLNPSTEFDDRVISSATCDGCPDPSITTDIYTLPCGNSISEGIYSLSTNPEATINVTPGLTPSRFPSDTRVTSPRNILSSVSTHPISSITESFISASSVISCSSNVVSPSLPMHPISAEKNVTPNPIVSNQLDTTVSTYSSLILHVSPSISMAKTLVLVSPVSVTDSISSYLVQYVRISTTSMKKCYNHQGDGTKSSNKYTRICNFA